MGSYPLRPSLYHEQADDDDFLSAKCRFVRTTSSKGRSFHCSDRVCCAWSGREEEKAKEGGGRRCLMKRRLVLFMVVFVNYTTPSMCYTKYDGRPYQSGQESISLQSTHKARSQFLPDSPVWQPHSSHLSHSLPPPNTP